MAENKPEKEVAEFIPSQKQTETINRVFTRFRRMQEERDKIRHEFDGLTLTTYINNSMDYYNGIVSDAMKATKEDWQSTVWDHKTRSKVKAVLSMIVGLRPFIYIAGKSRKSHEYASELFEVYEDAWKNENGAYKLYLKALSATCKGTVITEEVYDETKVKQKEIISVDQQTGKIKYKEKKVIKGGVGQVKSKIVPLLRFYPNENSAEIEHDCCVVELYIEDVFRNKFGKYENAQYVKPGTFVSSATEGDIKYKSISTNTNRDLIEVIKYYNEDVDEFVIMANGFWLNPQEGDECAPIPFNHKKLPFSKTVFELADEECFYGKSLPDLAKGEQDPLNAILRLMIDQEILSLQKPILLGMGIEIDSMQLYPGKPMKVNGNLDQVREMPMQGATQSGFQLLQTLKGNMNENTAIDPISQGVHSYGSGRKTAREAVILDENSKKSIGPFSLHIYKLLLDEAKLRVENIKQFYTKPVQFSVLKDKYGNDVLDSAGEKVGKKPQYREVTVSKPGKNPQWISIRPELKGCDFDIRFIEDFEVTDNRSSRIEMADALLEKALTNPLISADEATIEYLEAIRKSPDRFYIKPKPADMAFQNNQGVPPMNQPK